MTEEQLENDYLEFGRTMIDIIRKNWCPERSKREDSLLRELLESSSGKLDTSEHAEPPLVWDKDLNFIGHKVLEEMRCSELYGNIERDK